MAFTVNGELVDDSAIRAEMRALRPRYEAVARGMDPIEAEKQLRDWSRENVIERVLLRQEAAGDPEPIPGDAIAEALGAIPPQPGQDEERRKDVEIRLRVERLLARMTSKVSPPRHKEIGDYYRKNKERFLRPELVRVAHIVKNVDESRDEAAALAAIRQAQQEMESGASFEDLADRHHGELGWTPRGQMVPEFDQVVFSLKDNEVSGVFRTSLGFHIAKVYGRKPPGISEFDEVREALENALHERKKERAVENYLDHLKAKADIAEI